MIPGWGDAPTILIFGDSAEGISSASEAAIANGGRIAAALSIAQAADRLDNQVSVDLVILDVSADHGPLLDRLLRQIEEGANAGRFASIVTIAPELVDIAAAKIGHDDVSVLVGRDPRTLIEAMANGLARTRLKLREGGGTDDESIRQPHSNDGMAPKERGQDGSIDGEGDVGADDDLPASIAALVANDLEPSDAALIRGMIRARRLRGQFFGAGLFADPAWDILLDLIAARIEGRSVAVSSLCIAAAVPATTALRWIKQLTEEGLLRRVADPLDGRRVFIELTEGALTTLTAYFNALLRGWMP